MFTSSGLLSRWPSGPVMPSEKISAAFCELKDIQIPMKALKDELKQLNFSPMHLIITLKLPLSYASERAHIKLPPSTVLYNLLFFVVKLLHINLFIHTPLECLQCGAPGKPSKSSASIHDCSKHLYLLTIIHIHSQPGLPWPPSWPWPILLHIHILLYPIFILLPLYVTISTRSPRNKNSCLDIHLRYGICRRNEVNSTTCSASATGLRGAQ